VKNLTTFNQLQEQFQIKDFVEKTIFQINKDFLGLHCGFLVLNIEESDNVLEDTVAQLIPILKQLTKKSQLQQYIYQVDLKEKQWMAFLTSQNYKILSEQIIIREAQKVFLREIMF